PRPRRGRSRSRGRPSGPRPRASAARAGSPACPRRRTGRRPPRTARSSGEHEELELEHFGAGFPQRLADRLRRVVDPFLVDEHLLGVGEELLVVGHRLRLAAHRDHRSPGAVLGEPVADLALGGLAPGPLRGLRHATLAQQHDGRLHVAVRLLERALAVHHPGAGAVAQLLDEGGRDLGGHSSTSVVAADAFASPAPSCCGAWPVGTGTDSPSVTGSTASPGATFSSVPSSAGPSGSAGGSGAASGSGAAGSSGSGGGSGAAAA